jgi:hypothetical protein
MPDLTESPLDAVRSVSDREDLAYHQARVLLLVDRVSRLKGHGMKLDGLTKLAKLDFLVRYPSLISTILETTQRTPVNADYDYVEAPMIRYKYGPWDDRYYAIIGALVGRGLLRYAKSKRGIVALTPTVTGRHLADRLGESDEWRPVAEVCETVAGQTVGLTGNALKERIYTTLPDLLDRQYGETIR